MFSNTHNPSLHTTQKYDIESTRIYRSQAIQPYHQGWHVLILHGCVLLKERNEFACRTSKVCIVTAGMRADMETLHKNMKAKITKYIFDHRKEPSINALGQLLSTMLYSRRFFPYYTFNSLVGLDEKGEGVIYSYDAVGNSEPIKYDAEGSGKELATPILDARLKASNQLIKPDALDLQGVKDLCADALTAAAERDILTGDFGEIVVISRDGIKLETFSLRQD